jgi:predicted RecA/RadA family phage recombinase
MYPNSTGSTITAGSVIAIGKICGIAINDIPNLTSGAVSLKGCYRLTKKTGTDVIAQGTVLVYDAGVEAATAASTLDAVIVGRAAAASSSASTTVDAILGL